MAYTLTPGAPNYWHEASPPREPGHCIKAGKRARYSFISSDENGKPVRKWHPEIRRYPEQVQLSLRGDREP